ncbi:hypothetical protein D6D26_02249, partial [Aureobasidium pullulans]
TEGGFGSKQRRNSFPKAKNSRPLSSSSLQTHPPQDTMPTIELPIRSAMVASDSTAQQKPALSTLPTEIKNEIFSYLLLGKNVKYSTGGTAPGHSYTFHVSITRTNKKLHKEANDYLRSHNEFALIHLRYPRLLSGFSPYIAVGKKVKNFQKPAIEITVEDLEPKAQWPYHEPEFGRPSDRVYVQRVLFLSQDLPHYTRQIQLEIHVWPSLQIYVHPSRGSRPLQYTPAVVKNDRKIAWKINPSHRTDLTREECRARQERLIAPMAAVIGHGQAVRFPGVDADIADRAIRFMTPRIVSVDAVGWNLLEQMQDQKRHLDNVLVHGFGEPHDLCKAYVMVAQLVHEARAWTPCSPQYNTALLLHTPYSGIAQSRSHPLALMSFRNHAEVSSPSDVWLHGVATIGLECLLNAMNLALDTGNFNPLLNTDAASIVWRMTTQAWCFKPLREELLDMAHHYEAWSEVFSDLTQDFMDQNHLEVAISDLEHGVSHGRTNEYVQDDIKCLKEIMRTEQLPKDMYKDFAPGLRRRKRLFTEPLNLVRPKDLHGWTSDAIDNMDSKLRSSIIKHSNAAIKSKKPVPVETTRSEGHVMLKIINGTPWTPETAR